MKQDKNLLTYLQPADGISVVGRSYAAFYRLVTDRAILLKLLLLV